MKENVYLSIPWELIMLFPESGVLWVSNVKIIPFQFSKEIVRHQSASTVTKGPL